MKISIFNILVVSLFINLSSLYFTGNVEARMCQLEGQFCDEHMECCSGKCEDNSCSALFNFNFLNLTRACVAGDSECNSDSECCSNVCEFYQDGTSSGRCL